MVLSWIAAFLMDGWVLRVDVVHLMEILRASVISNWRLWIILIRNRLIHQPLRFAPANFWQIVFCKESRWYKRIAYFVRLSMWFIQDWQMSLRKTCVTSWPRLTRPTARMFLYLASALPLVVAVALVLAWSTTRSMLLSALSLNTAYWE